MALSRDKHKLVITVDNIGAADAIALKKMFEYMQYLGNIGSSRMCSFFADGDGSFHPKVSFEYPIELPEVPEVIGYVEFDRKTKEFSRKLHTHQGDFIIDSDEVAWKIYHDDEPESEEKPDEELGISRPSDKLSADPPTKIPYKGPYKSDDWEDEKPGYPRKMNGLGNF
jgi:hypothetical protein